MSSSALAYMCAPQYRCCASLYCLCSAHRQASAATAATTVVSSTQQKLRSMAPLLAGAGAGAAVALPVILPLPAAIKTCLPVGKAEHTKCPGSAVQSSVHCSHSAISAHATEAQIERDSVSLCVCEREKERERERERERACITKRSAETEAATLPLLHLLRALTASCAQLCSARS
jgi:hypothetical protein